MARSGRLPAATDRKRAELIVVGTIHSAVSAEAPVKHGEPSAIGDPPER